jgi:hypothetical protein
MILPVDRLYHKSEFEEWKVVKIESAGRDFPIADWLGGPFVYSRVVSSINDTRLHQMV